MIKAINLQPGDRVSVRNGAGRVITRTAISVGLDYVTIQWNDQYIKVPETKITSFVKCDNGSVGRRYGV